MAANKRTEAQREQDLVKIAALLRRGWSKRRIARELKLDEKQIRYDWRECLRRLSRDRDKNVEQARRVHYERYAAVMEECWEAWDRSKEDKEKASAETVTTSGVRASKGKKAKPPSKRSKAVKISEGRLPDPEYMRIIADCINRQAELDDAKPPKRIAGPGGDQGDAIPITIVEVARPDEPVATSQ